MSLLDLTHPRADVRTRSGFIRIQKGHSYMLPLLSSSMDMVLLQMINEGIGHKLSPTPSRYDATYLKRRGFVIASDEETLNSEFLVRQLRQKSRLGHIVGKNVEKMFKKPLQRIVARDQLTMRQGQHAKTTVRRGDEARLEAMALKLFKEELVRVRKQDLMSKLSLRAQQHIVKRLQRMGTELGDWEATDEEILQRAKQKSFLLKKCPILLSKNHPFLRGGLQFLQTPDESEFTGDEKSSNSSFYKEFGLINMEEGNANQDVIPDLDLEDFITDMAAEKEKDSSKTHPFLSDGSTFFQTPDESELPGYGF